MEKTTDAEEEGSTPIRRLKRAFKNAKETLQGALQDKRKASRRKGQSMKTTKKKRTKRVKWSNKLNSNNKSADEGEIKIDD
eukprot:11688888-Ditylum_brightwellii.AAC.1